MNIKKGDNVIVMAGKDRLKTGKVIKVFPRAGKVVIDGVNIIKRRTRPRTAGKKGQVIEAPAPLASAKVMIMCPACGRGRRLAHKFVGNKKLRVCRSCGHEFKS